MVKCLVTERDACGGGELRCEHGGRCVRVGAGAGEGIACLCSGPWGGARCSVYVGHDHACRARLCAPPALCLWGPDAGPADPGPVRCACPAGDHCAAPGPPAVRAAGAGPAGGAWLGAVLALLALAALVLAALYLLYRRRR